MKARVRKFINKDRNGRYNELIHYKKNKKLTNNIRMCWKILRTEFREPNKINHFLI